MENRSFAHAGHLPGGQNKQRYGHSALAMGRENGAR
jgi:hypothetical protein